MSYADEREVLGGLVVPWAEANSVPMAMPNRDFDPPKPDSGKTWGRLTIQQGNGFLLEISGPLRQERFPGLAVVQLFAPSNQGDRGVLALADSLMAVLRRRRVSFTNGSVLFRTPYARAIGNGSDGWYQVNVTAPFIRDLVS